MLCWNNFAEFYFNKTAARLQAAEERVFILFFALKFYFHLCAKSCSVPAKKPFLVVYLSLLTYRKLWHFRVCSPCNATCTLSFLSFLVVFLVFIVTLLFDSSSEDKVQNVSVLNISFLSKRNGNKS